ncbi:hypothetical protein JCM8097_007185 [Rhodosporidiobolus ruineniae]
MTSPTTPPRPARPSTALQLSPSKAIKRTSRGGWANVRQGDRFEVKVVCEGRAERRVIYEGELGVVESVTRNVERGNIDVEEAAALARLFKEVVLPQIEAGVCDGAEEEEEEEKGMEVDGEEEPKENALDTHRPKRGRADRGRYGVREERSTSPSPASGVGTERRPTALKTAAEELDFEMDVDE